MSYRRSYLTILLLVGFSVVAGKISVNMVMQLCIRVVTVKHTDLVCFFTVIDFY